MDPEMVCLTCGGKNICVGRGTEIGNDVDEKTRLLEEQLANRDRALEKLTRLTEEVRRDREEISRSLEKLRSLKSQQNLTHGVNSQNVEKTCQEVVQLLTDSKSQPTLNSITSDNGCPPTSSFSLVRGANDGSASPVSNAPQLSSAREVGRVKKVKCECIALVDDTIFVATASPHYVVKYHWKESKEKISIEEIKRSDKLEKKDRFMMGIAAAKTADGVRLYVCHNPGRRCLDRFDPDSLKQTKKIDMDKFDSRFGWRIAAWSDVLAVSDRHVIAMYNNDQLVAIFPYKHWVSDMRLSSTFLATYNDDCHVRVMRWGGDRLDITPVYTIERPCLGLAMSERLLMTVHGDQGKEKLVSLDLITGKQRQLEDDLGRILPYAFATEDLVVGEDYKTNELIIMQLR